MIEQPFVGLITSFQRKPYARLRIIFALMLICCLPVLYFFGRYDLAAAFIVGLIPGILAVLSGMAILRDKAQLVEIYQDGMIIREGKNNAKYETIPWSIIEDIKAEFRAKPSTSGAVVGGLLGGTVGAIVMSQAFAKSKNLPDALELRFKAGKRKLRLNTSYSPVFTVLQQAAIDYWLVEANDQLQRGQSVRIGRWEINIDGVITPKLMVPWTAISSMDAYMGGVRVTYWDTEKIRERHIHQRLELRGEVLWQLRKQRQKNGLLMPMY
jgi:hypothetical protein